MAATAVNDAVQRPLDAVRKEIVGMVAQITGLAFERVAPALSSPSKRRPAFALNVAALREPSMDATSIAARVLRGVFAQKAEAAGDYVNFVLDSASLGKAVLSAIYDRRERYGACDAGRGQRVLIEYSSPNIAKPFHVGHLRSTIIGNFIKNLHRSCGYEVTGINWLGDWGKQYGLLALGFGRYGSEAELQKDPLRHLCGVYVKANKDKKDGASYGAQSVDDAAKAYFRRMEDGDAEALALWRRFRELSLESLRRTYGRLRVGFDVWSAESEVAPASIAQIEERLEAKGLLRREGAASFAELPGGRAVLRKKDGSSVYLARDLAAAVDRWERLSFDKLYYVVSAGQAEHFQQMFAILGELYPWSDRCAHVQFGTVRGMSTRGGTAVFLDDVLGQATSVMLGKMRANQKKLTEISDPEAVAEIIGLSAVVVQDFAARRGRDYSFDWERMTSFEGDTGPYLQYTHARLCSIERKAGVEVTSSVNFALLGEQSLPLVLYLARYPEVVEDCLRQLEACLLVQYLFELARAASSALSVLRVKDQAAELAAARMLLFWATRVVLGNGLRLLGLEPLEHM